MGLSGDFVAASSVTLIGWGSGTFTSGPLAYLGCRVYLGDMSLVVILIGCLYIDSICNFLSTFVTLVTRAGVLALAALFWFRSKGGTFYGGSLPAIELTVGFFSTEM